MAQPPTARYGPSLANFKNKWVLAIGGEQLTSVEVFKINDNIWYGLPDLNKDRADASSCEQGDYVYTFGGLKSNAGY